MGEGFSSIAVERLYADKNNSLIFKTLVPVATVKSKSRPKMFPVAREFSAGLSLQNG